ncbi:uncharacterized protein LOC127002292 [Eriocheir sinensis]|uniref:uncharacterized protein LOC127002292 n=1 Tax=Eriocheir sinensis TaxID=95602 RepID=UPI0021CA89C9|nr:uncharacterized protein LOC127002292 [Eriocheir sinensis]
MFRLDLRPRVCQVRVDVVETNLAAPTEGKCLRQFLTVQGTIWKPGVDRICGTNSDTHFYLEVDEDAASPYVEVAVSSQAGLSYRWGLWITQIDCLAPSPIKGEMLRRAVQLYHAKVYLYFSSVNIFSIVLSLHFCIFLSYFQRIFSIHASLSLPWAAPEGCFQFFAEPAGEIKSFSFDDGQYYVDQHYRLCLAAARDTCTVTFTARDDHFTLEKYGSNDKVPSDRSGISSLYCVRDYLRIPEGSADGGSSTASHDRYCGGQLSSQHGASSPGPVTSRVTSSVVVLEFHAGIPHKFNPMAHGPGFQVAFQHNPCSSQAPPSRQASLRGDAPTHPLILPRPSVLQVRAEVQEYTVGPDDDTAAAGVAAIRSATATLHPDLCRAD